MDCHHCHKALPEDHSGACPFCENGISPQPSSQPIANSLPTKQKISWLLFFIVLLAPVFLTGLAALFPGKGDVAVILGILGGSISGIICGVMLGKRIGKTRGIRIILGIVFALIMIVVCVAMNCFGCLVSGYQLNLH